MAPFMIVWALCGFLCMTIFGVLFLSRVLTTSAEYLLLVRVGYPMGLGLGLGAAAGYVIGKRSEKRQAEDHLRQEQARIAAEAAARVKRRLWRCKTRAPNQKRSRKVVDCSWRSRAVSGSSGCRIDRPAGLALLGSRGRGTCQAATISGCHDGNRGHAKGIRCASKRNWSRGSSSHPRRLSPPRPNLHAPTSQRALSRGASHPHFSLVYEQA